MQRQIVITATLLCLTSLNLWATVDTPETRLREAQRYLEAVPPKTLFDDMADRMAANVAPEQRAQFKTMMTSQLDIPALTKAMTDAMVKHFTTDELKALADSYGSPVGKSAMQKFGAYMADVMPAIQAEITKVQAKVNQSTAPQPSP